MGKMEIYLKRAILVIENSVLDIHLADRPSDARFLAETAYEDLTDKPIEQLEGEHHLRDSKMKVQWHLKCQGTIETGILCWRTPMRSL